MNRILTLALAGSLVVPGRAWAAEPMKMDHATMTQAGGATGSADAAFMAANDAMMKGMEVKPTGNADHDFVAMMLPHHQGAVEMARIELRYGKDPELRKLATAIVKAQETEITTMRNWQTQHPR